MTHLKQYYQILDVTLCLESDTIGFIDLFDQDYAWFRIDPPEQKSKILSFTVILKDDDNGSVQSGNNLFSLKDHPTKIKYAYQIILRKIFDHIKDFYLIHAGVVAKSGNALILAGPPGIGKTTLVVEMLKKGFSFVSDDFCPVHKNTGLVHPFPRSLWTAPNRHVHPVIDNYSVRENKMPLTADETGSSVAGSPVKAGILICLDIHENQTDSYRLKISLKPGQKDALTDLKRIKGAKVEKLQTEFSDWIVQYPQGKNITFAIRKVLEKHKNSIWNVFPVSSVRPDFTKAPVLNKIDTHDAAYRLIRDLKNNFSLNETTDKSFKASSVFMELCEIFDGIPCYHLSVGCLESMMQRILMLFKIHPGEH